jgi:Rrf2 family protein
MSDNCRFAFALHVLSVLALHPDETLNSDFLAHSVNTNPVVIRRLLCELSHAGLVETQRGPRGGARIGSAPPAITLAQIHRAVSAGETPFGEHPKEPAQCCAVGRGIRSALDDVSQRAARAVEREYDAITLADFVDQIKAQEP